MSLLEGGIDYRDVFPVRNPYGDVLKELSLLQLEGAADVAVDDAGETVYIAGRNVLYTVSLKTPEKPYVIGKLTGVGSARQIEVQNGIAYITARPDGLFICDVKKPLSPKLLCHYDTVELATGVWVSGDLCFVTCRHFGVEILDIADPSHPVHLGSVLAGEAQSVFVDGNYMYVGARISREVQIFDISNPCAPVKVSVCLLDGFGDGVFVRGDICFAATGHHARRFGNRRRYSAYDFVTEEMLRDGYGAGHGLEIYDVSDKSDPKLLSRLKTPPFFTSGNDMWDVVVSGDYAFLADTHNGVFIINVKNLKNPCFEGYRRLDAVDPGRYLSQPSIQQLCSAVSGIAVIKDCLLAVSRDSGLHVFDMKGKAEGAVHSDTNVSVRQKTGDGSFAKLCDHVIFMTEGQIHAIVFIDGFLVAAAGDQGLVVLDYESARKTSECEQVSKSTTNGIAMDIKTDGKYLYVAEGSEGLSVWKLSGGSLQELSRCKDTGCEPVRQVVLYEDYGLAALHVGVGKLVFADISSPENITFTRSFSRHGMMYYKSIAEGLYMGRFAAAVPLSPCTVWYDLKNLESDECPQYGSERDLCPIEEGIAVLNDKILAIFRGKYYVSGDMRETPPEDGMTAVYTDDRQKYTDYYASANIQAGYELSEGEIYLSGRPKVIGQTVYVINRMTGVISRVNIADSRKPVFMGSICVKGNPEDISLYDGALWIPCGHGGLYRIEEKLCGEVLCSRQI